MNALVLGALVAAQASDLHIRVDQFGWRPLARKVAVLREPLVGWDAPSPYTPAPALEVRRAANGSVAFAGAAAPWNGGATHGQSGDRAWWLDFSALREEGTFYVHDPARGVSSERFEIRADVYEPVLRQTLRFYWYQRCGTAKAPPWAHPSWSDAACHIAAQQDRDCRSVLDPSPATARDLAGGWHDAGDTNKYVNFADDALHGLLGAWDAAPAAWRDDLGLPESGNGVPDLLDEVKWELDWLLRMQNADGSVLHKMGVTDFSAASPPSRHTNPRRYAPATASATISACGAFAHAAVSCGSVPLLQGYAAQLEAAARRAWDWLAANPSRIPSSYDNAGFASASAEDDAYWQQMNRLRAAVWLFRRTGDPAWRSFFDAGHAAAHLFVWGWASPWEHEFQDAWLAYATTPGATPSVAAAIRSAYAAQLGGAQHLGRATSGADAYRAWLPDADHTWGSNRTKALQGLMFVAMNRAGLDVARAGAYTAAAEDYLHYLHGVNPPGFSFLTNMRAFGGEGSVDETYHTWFADGTVWDNARTSLYGPAPGIVTGGANPSYRPAPEYLGPRLAPPLDQPILKAYRDWNANWPENSWEVTESHIPQQAAYVRLVAEFATGAPAVLGLSVPLALAPGTTAVFRVGGAGPGSLVALLWSTAPGSFRITTAAWALDLGLQVFLPPHLHILFLGVADGSGGATWSLAIPPGFPSMAFWFQASQVTGPYPVQSAVMVGRS